MHIESLAWAHRRSDWAVRLFSNWWAGPKNKKLSISSRTIQELRMQVRGFAFGNKARVGKDEACRVLVEKFGAQKISLAEPVYEIVDHIQQVLGLPREKHRELLQFIGEGLRGVLGPDIWLNVAIKKIDEATLAGRPVCISDMRYRNEADAFRKMGLAIVKIYRNNRPAVSNPNHPSEIDLDNYPADVQLCNNHTLDIFQAAVEQLARTYEKV